MGNVESKVEVPWNLIRFYHDPGHGWLSMPLDLVRKSGKGKSGYSAVVGGMVYLEEDCDAPEVTEYGIKAGWWTKEEIYGVPSEYNERLGNRIREEMDRYEG